MVLFGAGAAATVFRAAYEQVGNTVALWAEMGVDRHAGAATAGQQPASWLWLVLFFAVFTLGELYILPTGLGLFARLAPKGFAATTVAAWFLATFTGILALLAIAAAGMLFAMDRATPKTWG